MNQHSFSDQWQELSVRDVDYELIDAVCSIQWSLMFFTLYSQDHCSCKVIVVRRDQNNINATTSQSLKPLFLAAIANAKEMNAINIMNWCTQTAIACSNSLHSSLHTAWDVRRSNNDAMNVTRMYEVTACKRLQEELEILYVLQELQRMIILQERFMKVEMYNDSTRNLTKVETYDDFHAL